MGIGSNDEEGFGDVRPEATVKTLNKSASSGALPKKKEATPIGKEADSAAPELFEWAARIRPVKKMVRKEAQPTRKMSLPNTAAAHTVSSRNASRLRDALELDDDIAGYRRLQMHRKKAKLEMAEKQHEPAS